MYGPDSYLYETNLSLLATMSDEELTDAELIAQLTPGATALAALGDMLASAVWSGLAALGAAFAPTHDADLGEVAWLYPPLY